jgi:ABC-type branched-subunit amino acid transport system substrate-binding protein
MLATALPVATRAQTTSPRGGWTLLQCLDTSAAQAELARDYATGWRIAMQSRAAQGRTVQLRTLELAGPDDARARLLPLLRADAGILGLAGTVGEGLGLACIAATRESGLPIAHLAPWLSDTRHDDGGDVLPLFASQTHRLRHTAAQLASVGMQQLGVVFADAPTEAASGPGLRAALSANGLSARAWTASAGPEALAASLGADTPPVLLYLGGTPELSRLVRALAARGLSRYVVSLSDTDAATLAELGASRPVTVMLTQGVPNPHSGALACVREYRSQLQRLFDEAPSPLSLSGWMAGRYVLSLLGGIDEPASRTALLRALRQPPALDLGGFAFDFSGGQRRGSRFVTQTLLGREGRLIGAGPADLAAMAQA